MRAFLVIAGLLLYPLAVHALVMLDTEWLAVAGLAVTSLVYLILLGGRRAGRPAPVGYLVYGLLFATGLASLMTGSVYALFLPPVLINLGLLMFFAVTLRRGSIPLVERLIRLAQIRYHEALPTEVMRIARNMTRGWVAFFALMALVSLTLAFSAPLEVWSLFSNVIYYGLIAAMIVIQHAYRVLRMRGSDPGAVQNIVRNLMRLGREDPLHPMHRAADAPARTGAAAK
ncbi:MAG TPA: hypothetical protein VGA00_11235 [Acidiferrobacterales bacterium]